MSLVGETSNIYACLSEPLPSLDLPLCCDDLDLC